MKARLITQVQIQNGGLSWLRCTFAPIILALTREYHSTFFPIIRKGDYHYFPPTSAPPTTHHHLHSHPHHPFPHTTPNPTTTPPLSILHRKRPALLPTPAPPKTTPHPPHTTTTFYHPTSTPKIPPLMQAHTYSIPPIRTTTLHNTYTTYPQPTTSTLATFYTPITTLPLQPQITTLVIPPHYPLTPPLPRLHHLLLHPHNSHTPSRTPTSQPFHLPPLSPLLYLHLHLTPFYLLHHTTSPHPPARVLLHHSTHALTPSSKYPEPKPNYPPNAMTTTPHTPPPRPYSPTCSMQCLPIHHLF